VPASQLHKRPSTAVCSDGHASVLFSVDEFVLAQSYRILTHSPSPGPSHRHQFASDDKGTRFVVSGLRPSARMNCHRRARPVPRQCCPLWPDHRDDWQSGVFIPIPMVPAACQKVAMVWDSRRPNRGRILGERKLQADTALACRAHAMLARRLQHQDVVQS
jgi:hypothetical protein